LSSLERSESCHQSRVLLPYQLQCLVIIPEPTDAEIGPVRALEVHTIGHNLKDGRMMAGMGDLFVPTAALAASVFRADGIPKKHREFVCLRTAKLLNCPHPWDPNVRVALNVGASLAEIEAHHCRWPGDGIGRGSDPDCAGRGRDDADRDADRQTLAAMRARYSDEICRKYVLIFFLVQPVRAVLQRLPRRSGKPRRSQTKDRAGR
jgi:hypothetical protein